MRIEIHLHSLIPAPSLYQVPSGLQTIRIIESSFDHSRQGRHQFWRLAIRRTHFDVSLDPRLGEKSRQMIIPIFDCRTFTVVTTLQKLSESHAGHVDITMVANNEIHGDIQGILNVAIEVNLR